MNDNIPPNGKVPDGCTNLSVTLQLQIGMHVNCTNDDPRLQHIFAHPEFNKMLEGPIALIIVQGISQFGAALFPELIINPIIPGVHGHA